MTFEKLYSVASVDAHCVAYVNLVVERQRDFYLQSCLSIDLQVCQINGI